MVEYLGVGELMGEFRLFVTVEYGGWDRSRLSGWQYKRTVDGRSPHGGTATSIDERVCHVPSIGVCNSNAIVYDGGNLAYHSDG